MKTQSTGHMYAAAKTWNPFKGCEFACVYCVPSFQQQAKRQKHNCLKCYAYKPHQHPERLSAIPKAEIVFICGNGDISFAKPKYLHEIVEAIRVHGKGQTFYLQSKEPSSLKPVLKLLPKNVILVTTLETNRDKGYGKISKAPKPSKRYRQFLGLKYPRKVVTIEPLLDFDVKPFAKWMLSIKPEYIWIGFNSRDKQVRIPEPSVEKVQEFVRILVKHGVEVRGKKLRGMKLPGVRRYQD